MILNRSLLIILTALICSCHPYLKEAMPEGSWKFNPPSHYDMYLNEFIVASIEHDTSTVMDLLHPNYVKEQHDQNLEGRTDQFLKEFYGCPFEQVLNYYFVGYYWLNGKPFGIFWTVVSKDEIIKNHWPFEKREGHKYKVALWGAVG